VAMVGEAPESLHLSIAVRAAIEEPPEGRVWILRPAPREVRGEEGGGADGPGRAATGRGPP